MELIRRHLVTITAVILILFSSQLLKRSVAEPSFASFGTKLVANIMFPLEKAHHEFFQSTEYLWSRYIWLLDVESQRDTLLDRVGVLETLNSQLLEHEKENARLRELLDYKEKRKGLAIAASIVSRDPSNWSKTVTVDRGFEDGVSEGLAAVFGNGVVGQVISVGANSSKILLIIDPGSSVDALLQDNRAWGIAEGTASDEFLKLRYVEKQLGAEVVAGDRVIASGLDGVYPKGALIGVVHSVEASTNSLFYDIEVRRAVDFKKLESVLLVDGQAPLLSPSDASSTEDSSVETDTDREVQDDA